MYESEGEETQREVVGLRKGIDSRAELEIDNAFLFLKKKKRDRERRVSVHMILKREPDQLHEKR